MTTSHGPCNCNASTRPTDVCLNLGHQLLGRRDTNYRMVGMNWITSTLLLYLFYLLHLLIYFSTLLLIYNSTASCELWDKFHSYMSYMYIVCNTDQNNDILYSVVVNRKSPRPLPPMFTSSWFWGDTETTCSSHTHHWIHTPYRTGQKLNDIAISIRTSAQQIVQQQRSLKMDKTDEEWQYPFT